MCVFSLHRKSKETVYIYFILKAEARLITHMHTQASTLTLLDKIQHDTLEINTSEILVFFKHVSHFASAYNMIPFTYTESICW